MNFYEVWIRSPRYHGRDSLTYSHATSLKPGTVVLVPLKNELVPGIITARSKKPDFKTRPLSLPNKQMRLPGAVLELLDWLRSYYPASAGLIGQLFLPAGLTTSKLDTETDMPIQPATALPSLTTEQAAVVKKINGGTVLLHGDTGTGKTRVYMEVAEKVLKEGRSVLVLTPEISLTPQLIAVFSRHFGNRVIAIHSHLTDAKRRGIWLKILGSRQPLIVIGPRSALFSPLQNIGLIVVDEAHETAYKQEQSPYYYGLRVAAKLAAIHGCQLILGTATPPVSEYYLAEQKNIPILRMTSPAVAVDAKSEVKVIDLRDRSNFSRQHYLSDELLKAIADAIRRQEQSLVFLNRRGTARLVLCQACGWQALCPKCDIPLTYHGDNHRMRCHTCGYTTAPPSSCPECGSPDILFKSIGTKSLVDALKKEFPKARIRRFDTDNLTDERFESHYETIRQGDIDILVGTQILAKGLDLPKLSVLGVVLADTSLYFPDYTAEERTYQLLTQVLGRVGRGHIAHAEAIVQTYHPDSPAIRAAVEKDWPGFYKSQLAERQVFLFPPFCYTLKLHCERASSESAKRAALNLVDQLLDKGLKVRFSGPSPAFVARVSGRYRWQVIAKAKQRNELLKIISALPAGWSYDLDPISLL